MLHESFVKVLIVRYGSENHMSQCWLTPALGHYIIVLSVETGFIAYFCANLLKRITLHMAAHLVLSSLGTGVY